jgi:hypothetical protein
MGPRIITARSIELKFFPNHSDIGAIDSVVGHYSATPRARDWQAGIRAARSFHHDHQHKPRSEGGPWCGIGYHYLIPDDGVIICCRPVAWSGAHVLRQNAGRVGVNMPGTTGDRPTLMQARAFSWLLHHAHTERMPQVHRTSRSLVGLRIFGHKEVPGQSTDCPGLFLNMYHRGGAQWSDEGIAPSLDLDVLDGEVPASDADEALTAEAADEDAKHTGPDAAEADADVDADEEGELPEADDEFDEDLSHVVRLST